MHSVPLVLAIYQLGRKGINKWEWAKKIVDMENKLVPYLFLVLVITLPVLVAKLFVLPFI